MTNFELSVRMFLEEHTEHLAGVRWVQRPGSERPELVLDWYATLAYLEWGLARGLTPDPEKLRANIARLRAELESEGKA